MTAREAAVLEATTMPRTSLAALMDEIRALPANDGAAPALPKQCYTSEAFFDFERQHVFSRTWVCVGRVEQIAEPGSYLAASVADEPIIVLRHDDGRIHAMSAVCQHRGQVITRESGTNNGRFRCPLHFWTYDREGKLVGAPHMGDTGKLRCLKNTVRLPVLRTEAWHGFIFVNLDPDAAPLAPSLAKLEPFWAGYTEADLVAVPPTPSDVALPWNWKIHVENFTDAYHPGFVHRGTHDIAPSVHAQGSVVFEPMAGGDNAIVRTVPLLVEGAGMMKDGWGEEPMFPPIETLSPEQHQRLTFALLPPSLTLVFAPGAVAYTHLSASGVKQTFASNDRVTAGGWLLPRSTVELPDFAERAAAVREGGSKIWAQDVPVNVSMQTGKESRFQPEGIYGPLEMTLVQFNFWLRRVYLQAWQALSTSD
jgi:phenylpropionate dioxygenase-like ring-hydroxylating dioxygenase large terminal subunit